VTDVENACIGTNSLVLVVDSAIADRHIVAGEFNHFCAERQMEGDKRRTLHVVVLSGKFMVLAGNGAFFAKGRLFCDAPLAK
jgi:hypothetical protein